jgi:hypothetical protein
MKLSIATPRVNLGRYHLIGAVPAPTLSWGPSRQFRESHNFCSQHGGSPLFNQTGWLTRAQIEKAFGDRLKTFEGYRQRFDPTDRLLNAYFRALLA